MLPATIPSMAAQTVTQRDIKAGACSHKIRELKTRDEAASDEFYARLQKERIPKALISWSRPHADL